MCRFRSGSAQRNSHFVVLKVRGGVPCQSSRSRETW